MADAILELILLGLEFVEWMIGMLRRPTRRSEAP